MNSSAFLFRIAICFLLSLIPLKELEQTIYSARMELRGPRPGSDDVVILDISAEEFKELKKRYLPVTDIPEPDRFEGMRELFYWDPNAFKAVIQSLLSHQPRAVVVTWYIPPEVVESYSDPGLEAVSSDPKVVWSSQFDHEGKFRRPSDRMTATHKNFGFNNVFADSDGVIRQSVLERHGELAIVDAVHRLAGHSHETSADRSAPYLINYMGPPGTVTFCSAIDVLDGKASEACQKLEGKTVLLTREGDRPPLETLGGALSGSFFKTPFGEMSRAEILANQIDTIVNHQRIYRASFIEHAALILSIILAASLCIISYPIWISALAVSGIGAAAFVATQFLLDQFAIYIQSANIGLSLLITYLVFTGYRLAVQENLQWRSLKQAQNLRELDKMKSNFLSLVSHDLKTPLAKIQAVVDRLRREAKTPRELLDSIENSNNELKHYISSILNLSKIESQKVILNKKSNDINRIIEQCVKRLNPLAATKGIKIETQLEPLFSVECDEDLMRQVLTNLVDNAIKYSPAGSRVVIRSSEQSDSIQVEIEDFGPGIPKDQLPMMFRKFHRLNNPMHEQVKGTGLGLYLSKYFIELHGGTIRVQSVEGKGTTFSFTLPLEAPKSRI